ncbi:MULTISPECIES: tellurite resistance/C4-dicarboxylate transporter family protein [unclassified Streptomyces]|uniref:tellurite resistance/C4-dicarboxylate transporter family protein n=1 Tax=unclassified Streptomyces TaxID=2593676 RepID=UPI0036FDAF23
MSLSSRRHAASGTPSSLRAWWAQRTPASGAAVMATGIVSVGLGLTGYELLSRIWLAAASVFWLGLAAEFLTRLLRDRTRWATEAATPGALTSVAATTVLGTRFAMLGWVTLAEALLALAAVLWPVLIVTVVRNWGQRMPGAVFLGCVATQGLSVLAAVLAGTLATAWLAHAALVLFGLGLVLYGIAVPRFDPRQVLEGPGDQWIAGGALAISALAGAKLLAADSARLYLWNDDDRGVLRFATVALLILDLLWYVVLVVAEVVRPRLGYDTRRWATVFPLGMTAAATLSVAAAVDTGWLRHPGEALLWIAVAAWLGVAAGALTTAGEALRSRAPR